MADIFHLYILPPTIIFHPVLREVGPWPYGRLTAGGAGRGWKGAPHGRVVEDGLWRKACSECYAARPGQARPVHHPGGAAPHSAIPEGDGKARSAPL